MKYNICSEMPDERNIALVLSIGGTTVAVIFFTQALEILSCYMYTSNIKVQHFLEFMLSLQMNICN